jgi:hypothetical protein
MSQNVQKLNLKEINALKKKLNWGEMPAIYHMVSTSAGDLDAILTHGFESGYKNILNKESWNLAKLGGSKGPNGEINVQYKPKITLRHIYNEMGYELLCYPMVNGQRLNENAIDNPYCPFKKWIPETMRRLFRVNSLATYVIFIAKNGDEADMKLVKHIYNRVEELIKILSESFDIQDIKGYNIAEFYQEVQKRSEGALASVLLEQAEEDTE